MASKVLVTRKIPEKGISILKNCNLDCLINEAKRPLTRQDLEKGISDADAVITMLYDRVDANLPEIVAGLNAQAWKKALSL